MHARGGRERRGLVGEAGLIQGAAEDVGDLVPVAVERRDEEMGRALAGELHDPLGEVRLDRRDPRLRQRVVELDLVGREGLDLDDLRRPGAPDEIRDDSFASSASRAQCTSPPAATTARSSATSSSSSRSKASVRIASPAWRSASQPNVSVDDGAAPGADRGRRVSDRRAHRRVRERRPRRLLEGEGAAVRLAAGLTPRAPRPGGRRARRAPAPLEPAAQVEEARGVARAHRAGAGRLDVPQLVREHRGRGRRVPDGEHPAEATALGRVAEGAQLDARDGAEERLGPVADAGAPGASGRSGGT